MFDLYEKALPERIRVTLSTKVLILLLQLLAFGQVCFGIVLMVFVSPEYEWLRFCGMMTAFMNSAIIALDIPKLLLVLAIRDCGDGFEDEPEPETKAQRQTIHLKHQHTVRIVHSYQVRILHQQQAKRRRRTKKAITTRK